MQLVSFVNLSITKSNTFACLFLFELLNVTFLVTWVTFLVFTFKYVLINYGTNIQLIFGLTTILTELLNKLLTIKDFNHRATLIPVWYVTIKKKRKCLRGLKGGCYNGIKRLIGRVPLFKTTAQPTAGRLPYLA